MKKLFLPLLMAGCFLAACDKSTPTAPSSPSSGKADTSQAPDAVQQKLAQYAGGSATDCGRLGVGAPAARSQAASDCAMQASQGKKPFYVAYDMPGMAIGIAGNSDGKLFTVESQGTGAAGAAVTSGDCPSQLRVAASGRVTCFAPGDMGSMGAGHTAIPPGMPNPHVGSTNKPNKP